MLTVEGKKFDWKNIPLIQCVEGNAKDTYATARGSPEEARETLR